MLCNFTGLGAKLNQQQLENSFRSARHVNAQVGVINVHHVVYNLNMNMSLEKTVLFAYLSRSGKAAN